MCFPGGKRDPGDRDDVHTALREAEEEIGLPPDEVQVVCTLFPILNKVGMLQKRVHLFLTCCYNPLPPKSVPFLQRGLLVTPVVGFIEESFCPCQNPAEVSAVFHVPLKFFISKEDHDAPHSASWTERLIHSFHYVDPDSASQYHIWGLTAMFAIVVSVLALRKKPEFAVCYDSEDPLPFFQHILQKRISKL